MRSMIEFLRPVPSLRVFVTAGEACINAAFARAFHETGARFHTCSTDRAALDRRTAEVSGINHSSVVDAASPGDVDSGFQDVPGTLDGLDMLLREIRHALQALFLGIATPEEARAIRGLEGRDRMTC